MNEVVLMNCQHCLDHIYDLFDVDHSRTVLKIINIIEDLSSHIDYSMVNHTKAADKSRSIGLLLVVGLLCAKYHC